MDVSSNGCGDFQRYPFGGLHNKDYSMLGSILGYSPP